ncbi:MAG TPA: hypothetical protein ENG36_01625 [Lentisphaerae bacterium]|nr:hypothetical protein [Lentisphaerota bacterium]
MEYAAVRVTMGVFSVLPHPVALYVASGLASVTRPLAQRIIREALRRVGEVFPDMTPETRQMVVARAWKNLFLNAAETASAATFSEAQLRKRVDMTGLAKLRGLMKDHEGLIVAVPHLGNWELAGLGLSILQFPVITIFRAQKNRLVDRYLERLRSRRGLICVDRDDPYVLRKVVRHLRRGGVLAILPDVRARTDAVAVPFLGAESMVPRGMGMIACLSGKPILPAFALRAGTDRHAWHTLEPVWPEKGDRDSAIVSVTRSVFAQLDAVVRRYPDQYFWFNRRWIHDPLN